MPFRLLFYESSYISTSTMNSNKDFKGGSALAVLTLGTFCTILALSTDHWYDFKMDIPGIILFVLGDSFKMLERQMHQKILESLITAFQLASWIIFLKKFLHKSSTYLLLVVKIATVKQE